MNETAKAKNATGQRELFSSERAVISYVNRCADSNLSSFKICFSSAFGSKLFDNNRYALEQILAKTRLKFPSNYRYNVSGLYIEFSDASYYAGSGQKSGQATAVNDFLRVFSGHADALEEEFEILITEELHRLLDEKDSANARNPSLLSSIYGNNGIMFLSSYTRSHFYGFKNIHYYPGKTILYAYLNGQTRRLNDRERKTLDAALSIANSAKGDELQREKQIHDLLCDRITYYTDDIGHDDNDCAIGALLNGKADCDGYSDAFYLCGNLAGLNVRYHLGAMIHKSGDPRGNKSKNGKSHMRNLICIKNQWVMTDVTWDDQEDKGTNYLYYNIGEDIAKLEYTWDSRAVPVPLLSVSNPHVRNQEMKQTYVSSWEEVYSVLRSAALSKKAKINLAYSPAFSLKANHDRLNRELFSLGVDRFTWSFSESAAELYDIQYVKAFSICETEADVIKSVNQFAANGTKEFWLFFSPSLSPKLFGNDMRGLFLALYKTRLNHLFSYSYNENYRRVLIQDAEYYPAKQLPAFCSVKSMNNVCSEMRKYAARRENQIIFDCYGGVDLHTYSKDFSNIIYSAGVQSFSWSFRKTFVTIYNIAYYDQFTFCSSESEVTAYLKKCKDARSTSIRIYCTSESLYNSLRGDRSRRYFKLLSDVGCKATSVTYNDSTKLLLVEPSRW